MTLVSRKVASLRDAAAFLVRDWREADPDLLRAWYDTERQHWHDALAWDTSWTWATIERARVTWGLPGLIAVDESGRMQGWTFWMLESGTLNVGGLTAVGDAATAALLEGILDAGARAEADATSLFILDRASGLDAALGARGFDLERFLYLSVPLVASGFPGPPKPQRGEGGSRPDVTAVASLLHASYAPGAALHFAPHGTMEEWTSYAKGLVDQRACGVVDPDATRVVGDERGLQALALVTSIAPETAHLAQLAVRPDCRGRRLAATLLEEACGRAAASGKAQMTLLVGESNAAARRLYESRGFTQQATFTAARCQVARLSSPGVPLRTAGNCPALVR